jgi:hypothetical protein
MVKIVDSLTPLSLGDIRVIKRGRYVYCQELVSGGWVNTELHPNQTLTSVIRALRRSGFKYMGRKKEDTVFYYHRLPSADGFMLGASKEEKFLEALRSIQRLERAGVDVSVLLKSK